MYLTPNHKCNLISVPGKVRDFPKAGMLKCRDCELKTHNVNLQHHIHYEKGSMWSHSQELLQAKTSIKMKENQRRADQILSLSEKMPSPTLLDYGCGDGSLLGLLNEKIEVFGFEIEEQAVNRARKAGLKVFTAENEMRNKLKCVDLILLIHVIEHIAEPFEFIHDLKRYLKRGGYLIIETPNSRDALLELYKSVAFANFTYWSHHPILHTFRSLSILLTEAGFDIEMLKPIQRYGLSNHLFWLSFGKPGGHEILNKFFDPKIEEEYERTLAHHDFTDTLWVVAKLK